MDDDDNIVNFNQVQGGKAADADGIPENDYVIVDVEGNEFYATGFMIFTPHHLAIMADTGKGAIPVLVMPLARVKFAEIYDEDSQAELPL